MEKWQKEFKAHIKEMSNRELFDLYVTMLNGVYWEEEGDEDPDDADWMEDRVESELDYRLEDWFEAGEFTDDEDECLDPYDHDRDDVDPDIGYDTIAVGSNYR